MGTCLQPNQRGDKGIQEKGGNEVKEGVRDEGTKTLIFPSRLNGARIA
jgi:hypothetical protein